MCRAMPHPAWDDVFAHVSHAFYLRRTELEGAFRAPVQGREFFLPCASHGKARGHKSDKI